MLSPPEDLAEAAIVAALADGWSVRVASMAYRPVGFGSHHWEVRDCAGLHWFVTVDELAAKRHFLTEPLAVTFDRLRASLAAVAACGQTFAVPPVLTQHHEPVARLGERFTIALYPFIQGESFSWGDFPTLAHRLAVLDLLVTLHTTEGLTDTAWADDFSVPHRDALAAALGGDPGDGDGPYAKTAAELIADHAAALAQLLDQYDELVALGRSQPSRAVLTHGEPHPGNTMLTATGWRLIDWDTALVAPPERDLWALDPGDGSVLAAYADATGVTPLSTSLDLYRVRWDLADLAVDVSRFRRPHTGNLDDEKTFAILQALVAHLGR